MSDQAPAAEAPASKATFGIQRMYVKDLSFESPGAPAIFTQPWEPEVNVQFGTSATRISDKQYEVTLQFTVTAKMQERTGFIAEVKFAGIFLIEGLEGAALDHVLGAHCPTILYPYVREIVSDLVTRGTFPQFNLQPMNFEAVYAEAKRRREQEGAESAKH